MSSERYVNKLKPDDAFRDWLIKEVGNRLNNKKCEVRVFRFDHSSHVVCRYEFKGEGFSVMAKFFAKPTGTIRDYDPCRAMEKEYRKLKKVKNIIKIAKPIAINEDFNCVLVTEYIPGKPFSWYLKHNRHILGRLASISHMLRKLHSSTKSWYDKDNEFSRFHNALDRVDLDHHTKKKFKYLLGKWWHSPYLDSTHGCLIHHDATPSNYIFLKGRPYAIDFELSASHGNNVHDLGIMCAELKHFFAQKGSDQNAEPYIRHFLLSYCKDEAEFNWITKVLPFYMSYGLLRIARLDWSRHYRRYLLRESESCLEAIDKYKF